MFKKLAILSAAAMLFIAAPVTAAPQIGAPAPDFEATDIDGKTFRLSDHKGKKVILEWTNHLCPFVVKHYEGQNLQATQKAAADQGATWVIINSSAEGRQGYVSADEARKLMDDAGAQYAAYIIDASGEIGKAYDAKTTPHMFIIDEQGTLVYDGAIDDQPSANPKTLEGATNHVLAALENLAAGEAVANAKTQPYGCSVKYDGAE